jgi:hypothetical protein
VVVAAQVGTVWTAAYLGMVLPLALPSEYPQPLFVCGNYKSKAAANLNDSGNRFIADPGDSAGWFFPRTGSSWRAVRNQDAGGTGDFLQSAYGAGGYVWPFRCPPSYMTALDTSGTFGWNAQAFEGLRPNANNERSLWPCTLLSTELGEIIGTLDSVYAIPGYGLSSTQSITIGGRTFVAFQNVFRSSNRNFMAIEQA